MSRQRLYNAVVKAAGQLQPNEEPVFATATQAGNLMNNVAQSSAITVAGSLLLGVLSGGRAGVVFMPKRYGVLLTNQRLMFFASKSDGFVFKAGEVVAFPLNSIRAGVVQKGLLQAKFDLLDDQNNKLMTLNFATIDKKDGVKLAELL